MVRDDKTKGQTEADAIRLHARRPVLRCPMHASALF